MTSSAVPVAAHAAVLRLLVPRPSKGTAAVLVLIATERVVVTIIVVGVRILAPPPLLIVVRVAGGAVRRSRGASSLSSWRLLLHVAAMSRSGVRRMTRAPAVRFLVVGILRGGRVGHNGQTMLAGVRMCPRGPAERVRHNGSVTARIKAARNICSDIGMVPAAHHLGAVPRNEQGHCFQAFGGVRTDAIVRRWTLLRLLLLRLLLRLMLRLLLAPSVSVTSFFFFVQVVRTAFDRVHPPLLRHIREDRHDRIVGQRDVEAGRRRAVRLLVLLLPLPKGRHAGIAKRRHHEAIPAVTAVPRADPNGRSEGVIRVRWVSVEEELPHGHDNDENDDDDEVIFCCNKATYVCASRAWTTGFPQCTPALTRAVFGSIEKY
jgi:hypothetical protein